jgi:glucokinase
MSQYIGLDIGGTKTALVIGTADGGVLDRREFATRPERGPEALCREAREALDGLHHQSFVAVGASVGGPLDAATGIVYGPPNLPGWEAAPLREMLEKAFDLPAAIQHDAKACAVAEGRFGAARECANYIFLTFGTGLGCGVVSGGSLLEHAPGEVGHWGIGPADGPEIYGRRNAWEGASSGAGIAALARGRHPRFFSPGTAAKDVVEAARNADPAALDVIAVCCTCLGKGIALLTDLFAPERVVLGSLACRAPELFLPRTREVFCREVHPRFRRAHICEGGLGARVGDYASLCVAMDAARTP